MKFTPIAAAGVVVLLITGCSSETKETPEAQETQTTEQAPEAAPSTTPTGFGKVYTDGVGVKRAKIDPASVKVTKCRTTRDDYTSIGEGISYGAKSEFRVTNTTPLTGVVSLTVQYQNANGDSVAEGLPGANHIKPGQSAKAVDSLLVDKDDLPGGKVRCVVVGAEVYVPNDN